MEKNAAAVALGRKGGSAKTAAQAAAGRENVKKALAARMTKIKWKKGIDTSGGD